MPRWRVCVILGYAPKYKGYLCLDIASDKIYTSCCVKFHDKQFPFKENKLYATSTTSHRCLPSISASIYPPCFNPILSLILHQTMVPNWMWRIQEVSLWFLHSHLLNIIVHKVFHMMHLITHLSHLYLLCNHNMEMVVIHYLPHHQILAISYLIYLSPLTFPFVLLLIFRSNLYNIQFLIPTNIIWLRGPILVYTNPKCFMPHNTHAWI